MEVAQSEVSNSDPFEGVNVQIKGWFDLTPTHTINVVLSDFDINDTVGILQVTYTLDKSTQLSERAISIKLNKKITDLTDQMKNLSDRIKKLESSNMIEDATITRFLDYETGSLTVTGSNWYVKTREIGSSFIIGHPVHGVIGSPAPVQSGTGRERFRAGV